MNRIIVSGRITKDLELRSTEAGKKFLGFSIAVNEMVKEEQITDFFNCNAWEHNAEFINKYFGKGRMILIEGKLKTNKYTNAEGKELTNTYILVQHAEFMDAKKEATEEVKEETTNDFNEDDFEDFEITNDLELPF